MPDRENHSRCRWRSNIVSLASCAKNRHAAAIDRPVNGSAGKIMMDRRNFLGGAAALGAVAGLGPRAHAADEWPQRQVTIIVPFTAGGSADLIGRLVAFHLQTKYGVPFVVENRGGAGGS